MYNYKQTYSNYIRCLMADEIRSLLECIRFKKWIHHHCNYKDIHFKVEKITGKREDVSPFKSMKNAILSHENSKMALQTECTN